MISETASSHGSFFFELFEQLDRPVSVGRLPDFGTGCYLIEGRIPVYLKMSSKRKGPWAFTFSRVHQVSQEKLHNEYGECFTCLICGKDGIVGLSMSEFRQVLDGYFEEQENVSVRRRLKTMYHVKGRDGVLEKRVSRQAIFDKLRQAVIQGNAI